MTWNLQHHRFVDMDEITHFDTLGSAVEAAERSGVLTLILSPGGLRPPMSVDKAVGAISVADDQCDPDFYLVTPRQ